MRKYYVPAQKTIKKTKTFCDMYWFFHRTGGVLINIGKYFILFYFIRIIFGYINNIATLLGMNIVHKTRQSTKFKIPN